ncbi:thermonuclease family protein [Mammaliicoccus sciuri]|uniref:thermonuclease family protein n=1 Tax=Mammaliicoccus sciuri TaxID=1296 RepID=UPI001E3BD12D|nr:thermonuclease family protein [Mammaliicoccus sciuri]MCD8894343.1 thermonuclease family protein [Mammaliicoccus sciuri]MCD8912670.1 thermonuclease family protein [Mammaliicoccus sciuri]
MKKIILLCVSILFLATIASGCSNVSTDNSEDENVKQENTALKSIQKELEEANKNLKEKVENSEKNSNNNEKSSQNDTQKKSYKPGTTDRIPVELAGTVDGDTAKFIYNGSQQSFRFLLIDTPETKHPRLGKQPFGQEASDRTKELLTNANKIEVEFDVGGQTDKYQRYLAYIYVDGKMLNEILVREGLAKVAYVYPPSTRYLDQLERVQEKAKEEKLGIWSLGSAFEDNQANTQQSTTEQPATNNTQSSNGARSATTQTPNNTSQNAESEYYPNCTALRKVYPNGVPSTHPAYNGKLDRDKDNFACEVN